MKTENVINLIAVAIISMHIGRHIQEKKDVALLEEFKKTILSEIEKNNKKTKRHPSSPFSNFYNGIKSDKKTTYKPTVSNISFDTYEEAFNVLLNIIRIYDISGSFSVANLHYVLGTESKPNDDKYGWDSLDSIRIERIFGRYNLVFQIPKILQ